MSATDISRSTDAIIENGSGDVRGKLSQKKGIALTRGLQKVHESIEGVASKNKKQVKYFVIFSILAVLAVYFVFATIYFFKYTDDILDATTCDGYGFLMILYIFILYGVTYVWLIKPLILPLVNKHIWKPATSRWQRLFQLIYVKISVYLVIAGLIIGYLVWDTGDNRRRLIPLIGLFVFLFFGFLFSKHPSQIKWRPVIMGLLLQFIFGLLTIRWDVGRNIFGCAGDKVTYFLQYATNGAAFVYGDFLVYEKAIFAFRAISTIYFLGFIINILYHYGLMQKIVINLGEFLQSIMGTSICESVNSAANIFLGQSEAPLLLGPYLSNLTHSEIHSVMTSGFATVSGTVLAAYIQFGAKASHLITSSVMSSPAALCYSKLIYPETEETEATAESISMQKSEYKSALDAASKGASNATQIVLGIIANLIAFISLIYFINGVLGWMGILVGYTAEDDLWSLDRAVGYLFVPISYIMGVPWDECELVGKLIGIKSMVNEFVAFERMQDMPLSPRTKVIATYAICGFANPGSIGIMISAMSVLMPKKSHVVTDVAVRAFIGGSVTCFMTACIAALLIPDDLVDI